MHIARELLIRLKRNLNSGIRMVPQIDFNQNFKILKFKKFFLKSICRTLLSLEFKFLIILTSGSRAMCVQNVASFYTNPVYNLSCVCVCLSALQRLADGECACPVGHVVTSSGKSGRYNGPSYDGFSSQYIINWQAAITNNTKDDGFQPQKR